jgi:nucleoside-diphosphate-sugar epimerase
VTGASGYVGSHVVIALMKRGYTVRACVTDTTNPDKTEHLLALNSPEHAGELTLHEANLLTQGSYDESFDGCTALLHVGTAMGYGGKNNPRQVYDGAVGGTENVLGSVERSGSIQRVVYTSSFAAIDHPSPPGYVFTESDWATDKREDDPTWNQDRIDEDRFMAYAMAKVEAEHTANRIAEEDGRFDVISICPLIVLGPLLSRAHNLENGWHWHLARMLAGNTCQRGWKHLWNIVDVRDVGESQVLMVESDVCKNGSRYQLTATDESGELDVLQLHAHLQQLFPQIDVGGAPEEFEAMLEKGGSVFDGPRAHCDKARDELGLQTHDIEDTLLETGRTFIDLGLIVPATKT